MSHADRFRYPGLRTSVEVACPAGHPRVLRCHPLRRTEPPENTSSGSAEEGSSSVPFPTLFWLACDDIVRAISALEHRGVITEIEHRISLEPALRDRVLADHQGYIEERWSQLDPSEIAYIEARGFDEKLRACGIGGTRNFQAVKCLHLHYAHHLARRSAIGELIEERLEPDACRGDHEPSQA